MIDGSEKRNPLTEQSSHVIKGAVSANKCTVLVKQGQFCCMLIIYLII